MWYNPLFYVIFSFNNIIIDGENNFMEKWNNYGENNIEKNITINQYY